jgi:hypothetical protein
MEHFDEIEKTTSIEPMRIEYFGISTARIVLLSIITFGLYELYWFYKNWQAVRVQTQIDISPFWRAFFSFFFCNQLFKRVLQSASSLGYNREYSPGLLTVSYIVIIMLHKLPDPW